MSVADILATEIDVRVVSSRVNSISVTQVTQGLTGPSGSSAQAQISSDPNNAIVPGTDNKIFAPESFAVLARFAEIAADETAKAQARQNLGLQTIDGGTFN